jgi:hypothetical protein
MKKIMLAITYTFFAIFFVNCSAKGQKFTAFQKPALDKSILYIYRPNNIIGYMVSYDIKDSNNNHQTLGTLKNNGYIFKEVEPGYKELYGLHEQFKINILVEKNQIICLKSFIQPTQVIHGLTGITPIIPIDLNTCKREIQKTKWNK